MATNPKVVSNHTPVEAPDIELLSQKNRIGLQFENKPGELPSRLDLPLLVYRRDQRSFAPHHEICPYCKGNASQRILWTTGSGVQGVVRWKRSSRDLHEQ